VADNIHIFVEITPRAAVSEFVRKANGNLSKKIQKEFPKLRKNIGNAIFWEEAILVRQGWNVTDNIINTYINNHIDGHRSENESNISLE
jgi:putative transposase